MTKLEETQKIIGDAVNKYKRPLLACSFGKDSVTLLHIIRQLYGKVPFPLLVNDTGFWFKEIHDLMHQLRKEWDLEILQVTRWHPEAKDVPPSATWEAKHLKLEPTLWMIAGYGADCVIAGVRNDESDIRKDAQVVEKRKGHDHVHPILSWSEEDVWTYIKYNKVPYCSLYDKGYRSLGSEPFTAPAEEGGNERSGRALDKEKLMEGLRKAGYW